MSADAGAKLEYLRVLEQKKRHQECLPHLYGMNWYQWAWDFFQSRNRYNFLCAANQISKSSTQIRKCIDWATHPEIWQSLWGRKPTQFWYFYPTKDVATIEFNEKWVKEWLPRDEFKDHPVYGWEAEYRSKQIHALHFKSGVTVYFKTYEMSVTNLQTASVFAVFCDEELPVELYDEINMRIVATNGYFHMVFTATLGQELWRATIEERGKHEKFTGAFKLQVSMYDCRSYMDGSPGAWDDERIEGVIRTCKSDAEVQRRVFGKFVLDTDVKYAGFSRKRNVLPDHPVPKDWLVYAGVDIGSGANHPAGICFVAVRPDFREGRVIKCWRGDNQVTTAADVLDKFMELKGRMTCVAQYYDHQSRDFFTVASRRGIPFMPANKAREAGEGILNVLFKNEMLAIYDTPEAMKLVLELEGLKNSTLKPSAKDDLIDALRFACTNVPWDMKKHPGGRPSNMDKTAGLSDREILRLKLTDPRKKNNGLDLLAAEIDEFNEYLEEF